MNLPAFSLDDYLKLLDNFKSEGYALRPVSGMFENNEGKAVFLRHDVDLHITAIQPMAALESENDIRSTYFVPVSLHFNPIFPENQALLRKMVEMGHEIGLHYDLATYPNELDLAKEHLNWEAGILSRITGKDVKSICMHNPYKGQPDPFRQSDDFINPHDPRYQQDLLYVSDSCRTWRDQSLLKPFQPAPPKRVLLNTHPEVWLAGEVTDNMSYIDPVLLEVGTRQHRDYFEKIVKGVWRTHPVSKMKDDGNT
jgi:peptidoglycan/xylan/chitin deacetylase (PgdA/CDA1 family)